MKKLPKIIEVRVIDGNGMFHNVPLSTFLEIIAPEIKKIARVAAQEVVRDQSDGG